MQLRNGAKQVSGSNLRISFRYLNGVRFEFDGVGKVTTVNDPSAGKCLDHRLHKQRLIPQSAQKKAY